MPRQPASEDDWDDQFPADDDDDESTIPCPYCRRQIHEDSQRCPYCENYVSQEDTPAPKAWWVIAGVVLCLLVVGFWIIAG
jgi:hypothetical protein